MTNLEGIIHYNGKKIWCQCTSDNITFDNNSNRGNFEIITWDMGDANKFYKIFNLGQSVFITFRMKDGLRFGIKDCRAYKLSYIAGASGPIGAKMEFEGFLTPNLEEDPDFPEKVLLT